MKIERLMKLSLQYLELDAEMDVTKYEISDLEENDNFSESLNNMEHSIVTGLMRLSASLVLPVQEIEISGATLSENNRVVYMRLNDTKESIAHKIAQIYKMTPYGEINGNIAYTVIGNKIVIKEPHINDNDNYYIVYHPRVFDLEKYRGENQETYDLDLANLTINDDVLGEITVSVPDEMAMPIKYLIYSDLKIEDEPNLANVNKNYFESYIAENSTIQIIGHETEVKGLEYEKPKRYFGLDPLNLGDDDE